MANRYWRGQATAIAQVDTLTPGGTIEADDVFNMILTDERGITHTVAVIAGGTAVADVTAAMAAAALVTGDPEWQKVTVADATTHATVTANTAGVPFYLTETTTETGGGGQDAQTFVQATTQASFGPNDWNTASNWEAGAIPVTGHADSVYIDGNRPAILYGLDQSGITLNGFYVGQDCTTQIGSTDTYLQIDTNTFEYAGNGISWIDITDLQNEPIISNAGRSINYGRYGLNLNCTGTWGASAKNIMIRLDSAAKSVGICAQPGESFTLTNIRQRGGTVVVGLALTTTTIYSQGGILHLYKPPGTSLISENTTVYWWRDTGQTTFVLGTLTAGALIVMADDCTLAQLNLRSGATLDASQLVGDSLTISACDVYGGATIKDPEGVITWTAGIDLNQCNLSTVRLIIPPNKRITIGAVA